MGEPSAQKTRPSLEFLEGRVLPSGLGPLPVVAPVVPAALASSLPAGDPSESVTLHAVVPLSRAVAGAVAGLGVQVTIAPASGAVPALELSGGVSLGVRATVTTSHDPAVGLAVQLGGQTPVPSVVTLGLPAPISLEVQATVTTSHVPAVGLQTGITLQDTGAPGPAVGLGVHVGGQAPVPNGGATPGLTAGVSLEVQATVTGIPVAVHSSGQVIVPIPVGVGSLSHDPANGHPATWATGQVASVPGTTSPPSGDGRTVPPGAGPGGTTQPDTPRPAEAATVGGLAIGGAGEAAPADSRPGENSGGEFLIALGSVGVRAGVSPFAPPAAGAAGRNGPAAGAGDPFVEGDPAADEAGAEAPGAGAFGWEMPEGLGRFLPAALGPLSAFSFDLANQNELDLPSLERLEDWWEAVGYGPTWLAALAGGVLACAVARYRTRTARPGAAGPGEWGVALP